MQDINDMSHDELLKLASEQLKLKKYKNEWEKQKRNSDPEFAARRREHKRNWWHNRKNKNIDT